MVGKVNFSELDCTHGGKIGVAELDNPASLNALTLDMLKQLKAKLEQWENNEHIALHFFCTVLAIRRFVPAVTYVLCIK